MTEPIGATLLADELVALRENVKEFMEKEVKPREDGLEFDAISLAPEDLASVQAKAKQMGLWCIQSPAEHGGAGMTLLQQSIVAQEASQCRMGAYIPAAGAFGFDPPNVIFAGSADQIEKYGKPAVEKGKKSFVAISEPGGGADPARSIQTRATRTEHGWLLNGTKLWISGAEDADWGIVFARTDSASGRTGISSFVVERGTPGMTTRPIPVIRAWSPSEVNFADCEIPADALLGDEGQGFAFAQHWLVHARVPYAAGTIGIGRAALRLAIEYARNRKTFGSLLAEKQAIQWMVADSEVELRAAELLTHQAARLADAGQPFRMEASVAKVYATETAGRVVDRCIQVMGGLGVAKELPFERWYRELRIKRIGEGPSEVHRMLIARQLLGNLRPAAPKT